MEIALNWNAPHKSIMQALRWLQSLERETNREKSLRNSMEAKTKTIEKQNKTQFVDLHADDLHGAKLRSESERECVLHTIRPSNLIQCGTRRLCWIDRRGNILQSALFSSLNYFRPRIQSQVK